MSDPKQVSRFKPQVDFVHVFVNTQSEYHFSALFRMSDRRYGYKNIHQSCSVYWVQHRFKKRKEIKYHNFMAVVFYPTHTPENVSTHKLGYSNQGKKAKYFNFTPFSIVDNQMHHEYVVDGTD